MGLDAVSHLLTQSPALPPLPCAPIWALYRHPRRALAEHALEDFVAVAADEHKVGQWTLVEQK